MRRAATALCFLFFFLTGALHGQVGSTTDILTRTVTPDTGSPLPGQPPPRAVRAPDVPTPGSAERALTPELVARLPLEDNDLNALATLVPGVIGIGATDSTAAAFSVAGLRSDANAVTLDGLNISTSSVPQEGLRTTRVVTSTYDVSRGAFSGGLVAATTRGGANVVQGTSAYTLRDQALAVTTD